MVNEKVKQLALEEKMKEKHPLLKYKYDIEYLLAENFSIVKMCYILNKVYETQIKSSSLRNFIKKFSLVKKKKTKTSKAAAKDTENISDQNSSTINYESSDPLIRVGENECDMYN